MKSFFEHFSSSGRQMQTLYILIFVCIVILLKLTLTFHGESGAFSDYFSSNLLPELTGVILELGIILFVIEVIQSAERSVRDRTEKEKIRLEHTRFERRLRSQLRFIIRAIFNNEKVSEVGNVNEFMFHAEDNAENKLVIEKLIKCLELEANNEKLRSNILSACKTELPLILSLAPVCLELSDRHMKSWMAIAHYMQRINNREGSVRDNAVRLLAWISMFDRHSYNQGII